MISFKIFKKLFLFCFVSLEKYNFKLITISYGVTGNSLKTLGFENKIIKIGISWFISKLSTYISGQRTPLTYQ